MEYSLEHKIHTVFSWLLNSGQANGGLPEKSLKAAAMDDFISEEIAASMYEYKPRTFREKVKSGEIDISFRTNGSGRGYQYSLKDIIKHKKSTSTEV